MRGIWLVVVLAVVCSGCGKEQPILAGGKPVAHWVQALRDPDARQRRTAAFKLGNVGPADAAAREALLAALRDPEAAVRREVIVALVKCGSDGRAAMPILEDLRQFDQDDQVRAYAARGLENLQRHK